MNNSLVYLSSAKLTPVAKRLKFHTLKNLHAYHYISLAFYVK
jgi:hypothetical protein